MRIVDVSVHIVHVGFRNQLLVRVEGSDGTVGWGESGLTSRELAVKGAVEHYRQRLVGMDPTRRGQVWQELYRGQYFEGGRVLAAAISAIDIALYDLVGKAWGVPVYDLLGGRQRDYVPTFAVCPSQRGEEVAEMAVNLVERGWRALRIVPLTEGAGDGSVVFEPRESIGVTARWVRHIREAIGPGPTLGVDYHHRLSVPEAAMFGQMLPGGCLDFLEEPLRAESPKAYASLRSMTAVPFAIGEEFASKWAFLPYIEGHLTQFVRLDICNVGGFTEAMKIAGWAEAHYLDLMPHNPLGPVCMAASGHLGMAVPNFSFLEIRESPVEKSGFYDRELFPVQPERFDGGLLVTDAPGLGIEVDESRLIEADVYPSLPRLERTDGSLTNW
jgi:galactonate dehydratase